MPASDKLHEVVVRCLEKEGWQIVREQFSVAIGMPPDDVRRLFIDLMARSIDEQIVLIEVKSLELSPVHKFMELVGQYLVYRTALNMSSLDIPLYVAIREQDYVDMVQHVLGQQVLNNTLKSPIPFVVFDSIREEIIRWIPPR